MSIAAKMAKQGYMPKVRNKRREERDDINVGEGKEAESSGNAGEEKDAPLSPTVSAASKAASAMWLKNRVGSRIKPQGAVPGTSNAEIASMTGSRYSSATSLPYKMPNMPTKPTAGGIPSQRSSFGPSIGTKSNEDRQESKSSMDASSPSSSNSQYDRREFMQFMRSSQFAVKPNRLVRQCAHCQTLFATGHVCRGAAVANNNGILAIDEK